jgi:predicted HTH domain antitoxin
MISKSAEVRRLITIGIQKSKLEKAISDYINNNASISKAANVAGLSLADFADELNKRGIIINRDFTPEYLNKTWEVMEKI